MDKLDAMRVFIRVAQSKSFSKTADELNLPKASVSLAVQQLEAQLKVRLLHRTTRHVSLTHEGGALLERLTHLIDDYDAIEQSTQGKMILMGVVRVSAPSRFARLVIIPNLVGFLTEHSQLQVELHSSDRMVNLVEEGIDCAIRVGALHDSSLICRSLGQFEQINCAAPQYFKRINKPLPTRSEELSAYEVVQLASPTTGKIGAWQYCKNGVLYSLNPPARLTVNHVETYIDAAISAHGLIQVPAYDVKDDIAAGRLVEVLANEKPPALPVYAVYPHRKHLPDKVTLVINWIEQLIAGKMNCN